MTASAGTGQPGTEATIVLHKYLKALTAPGKEGRPNPRAGYIEKVDDRSPADAVELEVVLKEGAFEEICRVFGDESVDPLEEALLLRASLCPRLNYYGASGEVLEFGDCYLAAVQNQEKKSSKTIAACPSALVHEILAKGLISIRKQLSS